ncbi:MAG: MMPL family transporter [Solirubrobacteraceae bacterium]
MTRLTRWVLDHKRLVGALWLIITVAGIAATPNATSALSTTFTVPGKEGFVVNQQTQRLYGSGGNVPPLVAVVTLPAGRSANADAPQLARALARIAGALPGSRTVSYADGRNHAFVSADGRTTFALIYPALPRGERELPPRQLDRVKQLAATSTVAGAPVRITGTDVLRTGGGGGKGGPGVFLEALIGGAGALLVLAFVFASFIALMPMLIAIVSILTTFLLIWGLTAITEVSFIVQFLVALIGLGVSIDYSLLTVVRWREERQKGASNEEAVMRAMETAGRAVIFSGTTVAIGLLSLVVLPLPFLRSVGYGGMLIPLVTVIVSSTLLPVLLATVGPRMDWPHIRHDDRASRSWTRWAGLVVRHRAIAALAALAVLAALLIPATQIYPGQPNADSLSTGQSDARTALIALERSGIGAGALTPVDGLVQGRRAASIAAAAARVHGVRGAVAPDAAAWHAGGTSLLTAIPSDDGNGKAGRATIDRLRSATHDLPGSPRFGGDAAQGRDFVSAVYGSFPLMIALVIAVTFILLARAFRSLLLPLKAVVLNILSVGGAYGFLVLVWQQGHGSEAIWGIQATGAITEFVPLMVFAFLFGLSMDYEVFILARMREEYDASGSTDEAVVRGIGRTGRLVTSAALILFLAFAALASGPETDIKIFATGLAVGILLDATVVRSLLVPALVSLFGRWNWWMPEPARKLLRLPRVSAPEPLAERG